jgi:hypothetical protein
MQAQSPPSQYSPQTMKQGRQEDGSCMCCWPQTTKATAQNISGRGPWSCCSIWQETLPQCECRDAGFACWALAAVMGHVIPGQQNAHASTACIISVKFSCYVSAVCIISIKGGPAALKVAAIVTCVVPGLVCYLQGHHTCFQMFAGFLQRRGEQPFLSDVTPRSP